MSERPKEDVIERVRKLLSKTEAKGCTQAEAEAAFQAASRIMAEHNLDMAEVEDRGNPAVESWIESDAHETGRWTLESNLAYGIVHEFFFIEGFFVGKWVNSKHRKVLRFFGRPENVQTATWAFNALHDAFDRLFNEYRSKTGCPASDRRIFVAGVANGFTQKMHDERRAMEIERDLLRRRPSGSTALAVRGVGEQTLQAYREHHGGMFKKNGARRRGNTTFAVLTGSQSALQAGYDAGRSLSLNRALSGSQQKGLTGS